LALSSEKPCKVIRAAPSHYRWDREFSAPLSDSHFSLNPAPV
jgi:hypothetical protein